MLKLLCLTTLLNEFVIRTCEKLTLEKQISRRSSERLAKSVGNKRQTTRYQRENSVWQAEHWKVGRRKTHFSILVNNYLVSCELRVKNTAAFLFFHVFNESYFPLESFSTLCFVVKVCQVGLGKKLTWSCMADIYKENGTYTGGVQITI